MKTFMVASSLAHAQLTLVSEPSSELAASLGNFGNLKYGTSQMGKLLVTKTHGCEKLK